MAWSIGLLSAATGCGDPSTPSLLLADGTALEAICACTADQRREGLNKIDMLHDNEAMQIHFPVTGEVCISNETIGYAIVAVFVDEDGVIRASHEFAANDPETFCAFDTRTVIEMTLESARSVPPETLATGSQVTLAQCCDGP